MKIGILQSSGSAAEVVARMIAKQDLGEIFEPVIYSKENQNDKNVLPDFREGKIGAIVVAPGSQFKMPNAIIMDIMQQTMLTTIENEEGNTSKEKREEIIRAVWMAIRRDFAITNPRIAVVSDDATMIEFVDEMQQKGVYCHGPYAYELFVEEQQYAEFDAVVLDSHLLVQTLQNQITDNLTCHAILGMPCAFVVCPGALPETFADDDDAEKHVAQLLEAMYLAKDITVRRRLYDEATASPLPKLYHERKDDSEKVRFAVKKPQ